MSLDQQNFSHFRSGLQGAQPGSNKLQEEATEHTIAGKALGVVRNVIPGLSGSAESNDFIAHVAADTIASIPMVKTVVGGGIRATMLIDPTKGLESNAASFGLNFVEGMALNKVSRFALPESSFSKFAATKLGTGLAAESATHLTVGLGFGAIRSGFNPESWKDSQGNFSIESGAQNLIKGSATGALINLPAGLIGFRVAKASSLMLDKGSLSPRLASVITNAGSGYAAGGVFGGLDAVMTGQSLPDVLKSINQGGIIGAASGGLMGSFYGSKLLTPPRQNNTENVSSSFKSTLAGENTLRPGETTSSKSALTGENIVRSVEEAPTGQKDVISGHDEVAPLRPSRFVLDEPTYDSISVKQVEMPRITEVTPRLTSQEVRLEQFNYLDPNAKGPYKDFADFASNFRTGEKDFRIYKVDGSDVEIVVPETYAKELDAVRSIRLVAEQPSILDNLPPGQHIAVQNMVRNRDVKTFRDFYSEAEAKQILPILSARIKLQDHQYGQRALPEDILVLMDELPTRANNIKRVMLLDERNYQDPWHQQTYKPSFLAAATANETTGVVSFYQANRTDSSLSTFRDSLRGKLFHEDSHLVPPKGNLYDQASLLEKDGYYVTEYSKRNNSERWAEDRSKGFFSLDVDQFLSVAEQSPLRFIVIADEVSAKMGMVPAEQQSVYANEFFNRIKFTQDQVLPIANEQLVQHLKSPDVHTQQAALRLLERFATPDQHEAVIQFARTTSSKDHARQAFDLATKLYSPDLKQQFNFVWEQGLPDQPLRDLAIRRMRYFGTVDERAPSYANLLLLLGKKDLPGLAKQVGRMQTDEGAALAYEFAMDMGRQVPGYQRAVALDVLENVPSLRLRALRTLDVQPPEYIAPVVKKFVNDSDPHVSAMARDVLKNLEVRILILDASKKLANGGTLKAEEIAALGNTGTSASVPPLLEALAKGSAQTQPLVLDALAKFEPKVVKYYARVARKDLTTEQNNNLDLINRNRPQSGWMEQLKQPVQ